MALNPVVSRQVVQSHLPEFLVIVGLALLPRKGRTNAAVARRGVLCYGSFHSTGQETRTSRWLFRSKRPSVDNLHVRFSELERHQIEATVARPCPPVLQTDWDLTGRSGVASTTIRRACAGVK